MKSLFCKHRFNEINNVYGDAINVINARSILKCSKCGKTQLSERLIGVINQNTSDGYHTFKELYEHRMALFSVICNTYKENAWKSKLHEDGTMYKDYFVVGVTTLEGDYSYHYHVDFWGEFDVKTLDKAPTFDGHKPSDYKRLNSLIKGVK